MAPAPYWGKGGDGGRRGAAGKATPRSGADEAAQCRSDHPATTLLVSTTAVPYSSIR